MNQPTPNVSRQRLGLRQSSAAFGASGDTESASRRRVEAALWRAAKTGGLAQSKIWRSFLAPLVSKHARLTNGSWEATPSKPRAQTMNPERRLSSRRTA